jgi:hypothetical protein
VNDFEASVMSPDFANPSTGYSKYIDLNSFADYFIINELSKNIDAYKVSTYLYKDKNSKVGTLKIGPVWDFDLAWKNANYANGWDPVGWVYTATSTPYEIPRWWEKFMQDPNFVNRIKCRWEQLNSSGIISPGVLLAKVDSLAALLSESQQRNFVQWPILDANIWANPAPVSSTYSGHIAELKNWITSRYNWVNSSLPGVAVNCFAATDAASIEEMDAVVYPNPFSQNATFSYNLSESTDVTIKIFDVLGKEVMMLIDDNKQTGEHELLFSAEKLQRGIYFYQLKAGSRATSGKLVVQK